MATYTDNYQLTKPTYAEQADIGVINSNMNKIDNVMHSSQISLAPAYDQSQTYAEGDVVMYELLMYKCISPTTGVWDASKWERTTASESGGGGSAELDILGEASGAVASFSDGASAELAKCIAEIVPKQAGTGTPSPSNICPISGYTAVKVDVAGKNHVRTEDVATSNISVTKNINGSVTATGYSNGTTRLPRFGFASLKAGTYILSGISGGSNNTYGLRITDTNNQYILDLYDGEQEFTLLEDTSIYLLGRFSANQTAAFNVTFYPMIRLATESAEFEPYKGNITTTPLGQTVYGGQLNVLTGELTINREFITLDGSEIWQENTGQNGYTLYNILPTVMTRGNGISNEFYVQTSYYTDMSLILGQNNRHIYAIQINNNISGVTDLASWKSWLSNNNCQICFEVAPQTVQLTPQEVNSLLGQNNISADTGDVDIVYVKASAPIQPNPTGTPTATLKKLGIDGTVFEIPSGGGGGGGNVYGAFIDTNRVITTLTGSGSGDAFQDYTAVEDCAVVGTIRGNSGTVQIDGVTVAYTPDASETIGVCVYARRGQTVSYRMNSSSTLTVYGLTFGTQNIFTPQIYSTEERCVGVWIDNKPLYCKTWDLQTAVTLPSDGFTLPNDIQTDLQDAEIIVGGFAIRSTSNNATIPLTVYNANGVKNCLYVDSWGDVSKFTFYYTKTTDTAGSGSYNTLGVPMVHYSTNEQVIGTFEDENGIIKPLYQKMVRFTNISKNGDIPFGVVGGENYMLITGKLSSSFSFPYIHGSAPSDNIGGFFDGDKWSLRSGADAPSTVTGFMIIQYTKITD